MNTELPTSDTRALREVHLTADLAVIGGGIAGTCTALSAAREGLQVVLVQDRPVLGGNGSSEVRLWWLGATCHGMTNNRWAREPGIVNELLLENLYQNPEANPHYVDLILLDAVQQEPNITPLLNTAADSLEKSDADTIHSVAAFCSQNSTRYRIEAPLFCDASGDGILGFLAGAAFRMGAETPQEFDEPLAPDQAFGELLGDSIYFYTKDAGRPVPFVAPSFAQSIDPKDIRMMQYYNLKNQGCQLWWIESGGRLDTVHEAERIKWDLWKIVYGIWDYVKNSGDFPDAANLTLDWVGHIPGKRESRRFEGATMLTQKDVVHARPQPDTVGFGGWAVDLHPADGSFSKLPSAIQYLSRSLYPIPYRSLYSRNIKNLFLGGRTLSASHVAFGSTRVMCTLGQLGEVIGAAAALCNDQGQLTGEIDPRSLQTKLLRRGFHLPRTELSDPQDLAQQAEATATSHWQGTEPFGADWKETFRRPDWERMQLNVSEFKKFMDPAEINVYSTRHARGIYQGQRSVTDRKRVVNLIRSSGASQQRYGSIAWSGDVEARWSRLRKQLADGLNFVITGNPRWTFDIGAFFVKPGVHWFWDGVYPEALADMGYRELYTRWYQVGAFLPMFRSHGTDAPREIWNFGEPGNPFYDTIKAFTELRYRLLPYIYSLAAKEVFEGYTMFRNLVFDFREDPVCHNISDQFMLGSSLMVCPVLKPMYWEKHNQALENVSKTRRVYLPSGGRWYDFWTSEVHSGGQWIELDAPIERIPILIREGSIVPLGPVVQHSGEALDAAWEVHVYAGKDGSFAVYEDAGDSYDYEKGDYCWTHLNWNEATRRLSREAGGGDFPGLTMERELNLKIHDPSQPH